MKGESFELPRGAFSTTQGAVLAHLKYHSLFCFSTVGNQNRIEPIAETIERTLDTTTGKGMRVLVSCHILAL